jgi:hypothetical protein
MEGFGNGKPEIEWRIGRSQKPPLIERPDHRDDRSCEHNDFPAYVFSKITSCFRHREGPVRHEIKLLPLLFDRITESLTIRIGELPAVFHADRYHVQLEMWTNTFEETPNETLLHDNNFAISFGGSARINCTARDEHR